MAHKKKSGGNPFPKRAQRRMAAEIAVRHPMLPMPLPATIWRRGFLLLLRWKIKAFPSQKGWVSLLQWIRNFCQWLRNISLATCLLGAVVGNMAPAAFIPCAIAFYVSLLFLMLDLIFLERWPAALKLIISAILICFGAAVWNGVVSHRDPISFGYLVENGRLDVKINNDSTEDDYKDIDLTVIPDDHSDAFIGDVRPLNNIEGCALVSGNPDPDEFGGHDKLMFWRTPDHKSHFYLDRFRIHCRDLPPMSHQSYTIQLISNKTPPEFPMPQLTTPQRAPEISGQFTGRFRIFKVGAFCKSFQ